MIEHNFFTDHYEALLIVTHTALMAGVIFFMALSATFQIGLLIAVALFLIVMLHSSDTDEPPYGAIVEHAGIACPRAECETDEI